jgi:hypothetical protein
MAECSELMLTVNDLAMNLASRPDVKNLDDVTRAMKKLVPNIDRGTIIDAIVATTQTQNRKTDDILNAMNAIRREARITKNLRNKIMKQAELLRQSKLPEGPKRKKRNTQLVENLREVSKSLRKQLNKSEPAVKRRLEAGIAVLEDKLDTGDILPVPKPQLQQSTELEKLQIRRDILRQEIRNRIRAMKPKSIWEYWATPFNAARGIMASTDFSAVFRQGGFFALGHPIKAVKILGPTFRAFKSKEAMFRIDKQIHDHPLYPLARKAKLFIAPVDGNYKLSGREEIMQSEWLDKIPFVAGSNRAYVTFLNMQRMQMFDTLIKGLTKNADPTIDEATDIARFVNTATGRGDLGALEQAALPLNTVFFAPRYVASRFQLLLGSRLTGKNVTLQVRKAIAKEYARYLIGMAAVYALAQLAGAETEDDPTSSDFGKIKFGNTRIDPLSGLSQTIVLLGRTTYGTTKSSVTGKVTPLVGDVPFGRGSLRDVYWRFIQSKFSPMFSNLLDLRTGENIVGEPVTIQSTALSMVTPLSMREIYDTIREQGIPAGTAISIMSIFGMGVQTYGPRVKNKGKKTYKFGT